MAYGKLNVDFIETSQRYISIDGLVDLVNTLEQQQESTIYSFSRLSPDANGIYTVIEYTRADGTVARRSTLSGGISPQYTTRTVQFYNLAGTAVVDTKVFTLTYNNGELISEIEVID